MLSLLRCAHSCCACSTWKRNQRPKRLNAATTIQAAVRGLIARRLTIVMRSKRDLERRKSRVEAAKRRAAAHCIERAWCRRRRMAAEKGAGKRTAEWRRGEAAQWRRGKQEMLKASRRERVAAAGAALVPFSPFLQLDYLCVFPHHNHYQQQQHRHHQYWHRQHHHYGNQYCDEIIAPSPCHHHHDHTTITITTRHHNHSIMLSAPRPRP